MADDPVTSATEAAMTDQPIEDELDLVDPGSKSQPAEGGREEVDETLEQGSERPEDDRPTG